MHVQVNAAELEKYNANNRGKSSPDCVKRAISLAFDYPYYKVAQLLNAKMKEMGRSEWNILPVYKEVIKDLGGSSMKRMDPNNITVAEFVDNYADPNKRYMLVVGKEPDKHSHIVCIRDNKIWDSWDCSEWYIYSIAEVDGTGFKAVTDIKDEIPELASKIAVPYIQSELIKFMNKKAWEGTLDVKLSIKTSYTVMTRWTVVMTDTDIIPKIRTYKFEIGLTIEPTMTYEEADQYIRQVGKQRAYDRMYAIFQEEKKLVEEADFNRRAAAQDGEKRSPWFEQSLDGREERFYRSLPGWARPLVVHLRIQYPGLNPDSYAVRMNKLPNDTSHPNRKAFTLYGYNSDEIRESLNRYKDTFEIEGIDYYRD